MKKGSMFMLTVIGFVLIAVGIYYLKASSGQDRFMIVLPYICIGVGCGTFGHGMGQMISNKAMKSQPDIQKQIEIEKNDERNIEIANRAKGKAYDSMIYIFGALIMSLGFMDIPVYIILMVIFAYLMVIGIYIYYSYKYDKEM